jgi:hypothetical protein
MDYEAECPAAQEASLACGSGQNKNCLPVIRIYLKYRNFPLVSTCFGRRFCNFKTPFGRIGRFAFPCLDFACPAV